jgi:RNA polymerase sigma-70 factor (ECF subfamily)
MKDAHGAIREEMVALLPRLRRYALSLTGKAADADDLVQDTIVRALRSIDQWQPGTQLDRWMFRITKNLWLDNMRANQVRRRVASTEPPPEPVDGERAIQSRMELDATRRALQDLPEEQRLVVALVLIDGMSYRDAADVLEVPIGTVTSRLARARAALAARVFGEVTSS